MEKNQRNLDKKKRRLQSSLFLASCLIYGDSVRWETISEQEKRKKKVFVDALRLEESMRDVRNNFFHGEKGSELDPYKKRDFELVTESLKVLSEIIKLKKFKKYFENEYDQYS